MRQISGAVSSRRSPRSPEIGYKTPKSNKSKRTMQLTPLSPNHSSDSESSIPSILSGADTPWSNKKPRKPNMVATPKYPQPNPQYLNDLGLNQSQMQVVYAILFAVLSFITVITILSLRTEKVDSKFIYGLFALAVTFVLISFFFIYKIFRK